MTLAPFLALHLLASVQGQITDKEKEDIKKSQQESKPPDVKKADAQFLIDGHKPRTCDEKCTVLKKMSDSWEGEAKKKGINGSALKAQSEDMARVCEDSCREKGKIDPAYMKAHMKKPTPPANRGPKPSSLDDATVE